MSKSSPVCECISLKKQIFAYQAERKMQAVTVIRVRMWATSPWGGHVPWHEVFIKMSWQEWDSPLQVGGLEARAAPVSFLSSSASNFFFGCKIARNCWVHVKKLWHAFQVPHSDSKGKVYYLQLWVLGGKVAILFVVWASLPGLKQNQYKKFLICGQADHSLPFPWDGNQSFSSENLAMLVFCKAEKCLQCR